MNYQDVQRSLLRLHQWRATYNGDELGRGIDQYKPSEAYHYAEAYALWGIGYLTLFQLTREPLFLDLAEKAAEWLQKHPSPKYQHYSWGLPWEWETWEAPKELSYLITTVFAGRLFLTLYKVAHKKHLLKIAQDIACWIEKENGGENTPDGRYFYYANFDGLRLPIINATGAAGGFFALLYEVTQEEHYYRVCRETVRWTLRQQTTCGTWRYSPQTWLEDNVHTAFTLEGLWQAHLCCQEREWLSPLKKGTLAYWRFFFSENGYGQERKRGNFRDLAKMPFRRWVKDMSIKLKLSPNDIPETRLHGYGSALRALALASYAEPHWLKKAWRIYLHVENHLAMDDGSYAFRERESVAYIRHQAHLFAGLSFLARRLQEAKCSIP